MTTEGGTKNGHQGEWTDTPRGPSWADVWALVRAFEQEFDLQVHFRLLGDASPGRWSGRACRVCAVALRIREKPQDSVLSCAVFGGNGGASTMPGACVAALYELESVVTDPARTWQAPRYELA